MDVGVSSQATQTLSETDGEIFLRALSKCFAVIVQDVAPELPSASFSSRAAMAASFNWHLANSLDKT